MTKSSSDRPDDGHIHRWTIWDPFNFDGPIFECRCGQRRLEVETTRAPEAGLGPGPCSVATSSE